MRPWALAVTLAQRLHEVPLGELTVDFEVDRDSVIICSGSSLDGRDYREWRRGGEGGGASRSGASVTLAISGGARRLASL